MDHHVGQEQGTVHKRSCILSDVLQPTLTVICEPAVGAGAAVRLIEKHGDAKLTTLLDTLTGRLKPRKGDFRDLCKAVYGQTIP